MSDEILKAPFLFLDRHELGEGPIDLGFCASGLEQISLPFIQEATQPGQPGGINPCTGAEERLPDLIGVKGVQFLEFGQAEPEDVLEKGAGRRSQKGRQVALFFLSLTRQGNAHPAAAGTGVALDDAGLAVPRFNGDAAPVFSSGKGSVKVLVASSIRKTEENPSQEPQEGALS